jgi:selenocysteine lyase/cysteine desulfurase
VAEGLTFTEGDEIIIGDIEFPSNVYPWMNLARKGVKVKVVKNIDGRLDPAMYEKAITSRTKLIALSSVQYASGYRADLTQMADLCHSNGAFLFVDAIQSLGAIPMDVKKSGVDFMSCGGHKWLCALEGIGIFYCAEKNREKLSVTRAGWHTVDNALDFGDINFTIRDGGERFEDGTANQIGIYALNAALDMLLSAGIDNIYEHILSLGDKLRSGLTRLGFDLITPHENKNELSGITIFSHKDPERTKDKSKTVLDNNILIIERNDTIRVSPHFFNTEGDIDRLINVLGSASPYA